MRKLALRLCIFLTSACPFAARADLADQRVLFHAGLRTFIEEDIQNHGLSAEVWQSAILGNTNFDLPTFRKGLYGGEALANVGLYVLYQALAGHEPWVMAIHLKPECVTPQATYDSNYDLSSQGDSRFVTWYLSQRAKYKRLEPRCLIGTLQRGNWEDGALYSVAKADARTQTLTRLCTPVLNDFLNAESIRIANDPVNDNSWYIRDRSCIDDIRGSADDWFAMILHNQIGDPRDDFSLNLLGDPVQPGVFSGGGTLMTLKVLSETTLLDAAHTAWLTQALNQLPPFMTPAPAALDLNSNNDNLDLVRHALTAAANASASPARVSQFQGQLKAVVSEIVSGLGAACHGGTDGVPRTYRAACNKASAALSTKLLAVLLAYETSAAQ